MSFLLLLNDSSTAGGGGTGAGRRMSLTLGLGLCLTTFLAGCAPALTYRIEGPATDEQRAALVDGVASWNAHTDAKHKLHISAKGDYVVSFPERIIADGRDWDGRECTRHTFADTLFGNANCPTAPSVRVIRALTGVRLLQVMRHELGHSLGIRHIDEDGPLMGGPGRVKATDITERDITECRRVHACPEKTP